MLVGIYYGHCSLAIFLGSLIGIPGISYLCGISFSPIHFYEPVGTLYGSSTSGFSHGDYNGIYDRSVDR